MAGPLLDIDTWVREMLAANCRDARGLSEGGVLAIRLTAEPTAVIGPESPWGQRVSISLEVP